MTEESRARTMKRYLVVGVGLALAALIAQPAFADEDVAKPTKRAPARAAPARAAPARAAPPRGRHSPPSPHPCVPAGPAARLAAPAAQPVPPMAGGRQSCDRLHLYSLH